VQFVVTKGPKGWQAETSSLYKPDSVSMNMRANEGRSVYTPTGLEQLPTGSGAALQRRQVLNVKTRAAGAKALVAVDRLVEPGDP
jgi:hypothetical protein